MMGRRGVSDIIGAKYPEGTAFFLEIKLPGYEKREENTRLQEQKEFLFEAGEAGAITGIVTSMGDIKKLGL